MSAAESEEIVNKRGKFSSPVWQFFGYYKSDRSQTNAVCKLCKTVVPAKSGNTTNLMYHLSRAHPLEHSRIQPTTSVAATPHKQQTTMERYSASVPYDKETKRYKDITEAVAYHIAKDMLPFSTVEKSGYKKLIHVLDPRYVLPGRKYFSKTAIPKLYVMCKESVQQEILSAKYFATTSDLWSSRTSEPYISLTIHFIDNEWGLKTRCLETAYFPEDHTGEVIAEGLKEALLSWGLIEDKMVCITTDSGANVVKATSLNNWTRLQCFGHRLHSAIGAAGKDKRVERAVGVCKKVVSSFSYSWKKKSALSKAQERLNLPKHQLVTESLTRWGSRQKMVARVLEQQKAITEVLSSDKNNRHLIPTWQDIDVLESMHAALTPLLEFTDSLSGESYVTVSYVKPVLNLFRSSLLKVNDGDTQLTKELKTKIMTYLDEKYADPDTDDLLDMATFVDPRFKGRYIRPEKVGAIQMRAVSEIMDEDQGQSQAGPSEGAADQGAEGGAVSGPPMPLGVKNSDRPIYRPADTSGRF
ncbi:E3 SUMO-protein ligase ZBED1-like [Misgurnus anguillicaudatus]|uniref:E3 SUMO-protein ligase ZBED1-like n=1 Tax=Misgurnus anguillicaudatus TaxID=75329 RepID=UPI00243505E1|nr:E3 SUMO-protein ligase ZBED1-like [Misgurnus anguillicaudatus]